MSFDLLEMHVCIYVKLVTKDEGNLMALFSIAKHRGVGKGATPFPG